MTDYTVAPHHDKDLSKLEPYIIEGVAYSPLKMTFHSSNHDESLEVRCDSCEWATALGKLPKNLGYVEPDLCPDCAKNGELGFVRCESPADGTFPTDWQR
jgi:hypothetical protein